MCGVFHAGGDTLGLPKAPRHCTARSDRGLNRYLRDDVGWENVQIPALSGDFATLLNNENIISAGLGGCQFDDWLRMDLTLEPNVVHRSGVLNN